MMRMDAAIARLSSLVCSAAGMKGDNGKVPTAMDLQPFMDEKPDLTPEGVMKSLGVRS